ncbi:hypothetical protein PG985_001436 [Apiospora marii]|uniref:uncharacterized protein n=1 Tax=Apiospora marii TaxID=335849 RepID=UPI00312EC130
MGPSALIETLEPQPQPASLFLTKLPPEVRSQIYDCVFGCRHLHIFIYEKKLVCLVCQHPAARDPDEHTECIGMSMSKSKRPWNDDGIKQQRSPLAPDEKRQHLSALLTVCRTMYLETADSLYRTHTFHFSNIVSLLVFPRETIPHHRALLRDLRIDLFLLANRSRDPSTPDKLYIFLHNSLGEKWDKWDKEAAAAASGGKTPWECAWAAVAELPSLRTLTVSLEISNPSGEDGRLVRQSMSADTERALLGPLARVTCRDYTLRVNWPAPETALDTAEEEEGRPKPAYPFRIERFTSKGAC